MEMEAKHCPQCGEGYDVASSFCNNDGAQLIADTISGEPQLLSASIVFAKNPNSFPLRGDYSKLLAKSRFSADAESHQIWQGRTKWKTIQKNLWLIAYWTFWAVLVGIGGLLASFILPFTAILLILGAVVYLLFVIGLLLHSAFLLLDSSKAVRCPVCLAIIYLRRGNEKGMCNAGHLLLFGKAEQPEMRLLQCFYCSCTTAVAEGFGDFICPDCGAKRNSDPAKQDGSLSTCLYCNIPLPSGVIYCHSCGKFLTTKFRFGHNLEDFNPPYDMDWRIGKGATGHLLFAIASINGIHNRARSGNDIQTFAVLLQELKDAIMSLEHALHTEYARPIVEQVLPYLDLAYATVLDYGCRIFDLGSYSQKNKETMASIETEAHISTHKRLEAVYGGIWNEIGCAGDWKEGLLSFTTYYSDGVALGRGIKSIASLRQEAERFSEWARKNRFSA